MAVEGDYRVPLMEHAAPSDLGRFADLFGFRHDLLAGADPYAIAHARPGFSGRVEAIRITENGRFGNIFYQLLHAIILARQLGCRTILAFPFAGGPDAPAIAVEELRIVFRPDLVAATPPVPTLVGHFFNSFAFESALRSLPPEFVRDTIQRYLKPLFRDTLRGVQPGDRRSLVMSFRGGDVFQAERPSPWYVQPPASYYMKAFEMARAELGVQCVTLVYEDRSNPAVAIVEEQLAAAGVKFSGQSASLVEDLSCLAGARHLVVPTSTLGEAAALLSEHVETYFGFRNFESHEHIHQRPQPLLLGVLRRKGVRAVLIEDAANDYIPARSWDASAAQRAMIADYPMDKLRLLEGEAADRREMQRDAGDLRMQLAESLDEASRIRHLLIATQLRFEHLDRKVHQSTSWRVTAPLRWSAQLVRRLRGRADEAAGGIAQASDTATF